MSLSFKSVFFFLFMMLSFSFVEGSSKEPKLNPFLEKLHKMRLSMSQYHLEWDRTGKVIKVTNMTEFMKAWPSWESFMRQVCNYEFGWGFAEKEKKRGFYFFHDDFTRDRPNDIYAIKRRKKWAKRKRLMKKLPVELSFEEEKAVQHYVPTEDFKPVDEDSLDLTVIEQDDEQIFNDSKEISRRPIRLCEEYSEANKRCEQMESPYAGLIFLIEYAALNGINLVVPIR